TRCNVLYCFQSEVFFTYERTCTTCFRSDPQARRIRRIFSMERRNSFSNVSEMTAPLAGSVDAWPETNSKFPTLVAGLKGRCVLDTSGGTGYSMRVMPRSVMRWAERCQSWSESV